MSRSKVKKPFDRLAAQRARYNRLYWPKCADCGVIARNYPDSFGCLECYARKQPTRDWSTAEIDYLERYTGTSDVKTLQFFHYAHTGVARSRCAIRNQFKVQGLKITTHQDGYTVGDIAKLIGLSYNGVMSLLRDGHITNIAKGKRILISIEDGDRLIKRYSPPEQPTYTMEQAADIIGCDKSTIRSAVHRGLPSWKQGHTRRVCKVTVDRAVAHLRDTGAVRVPWGSLAKQ